MGKDPLWTIMVYLAGDNNLTEEMVLALKEMSGIGGDESFNIVAQFDPSGLGVPTRRFDFTGGGGKDGGLPGFSISKPEELKETNTGNPEALSDFIVWAATKRPAENYFLVLSGHGSGAEEDFLQKDESPLDSLTIPELQWALCHASSEIKGKIRILGLDNCLMSTAEVVDAVSRHHEELKYQEPCKNETAHVETVIASEGLVPSQGWPYYRFFKAINEAPGSYQTVEKLQKLVVESFACFYSDYDFAAGMSADIAAIEVKQIGSVTDSLKKLVVSMAEAMESEDKQKNKAFVDQLILAHWQAQTYKFGQYVDLRDFCQQLGERCQTAFPPVGVACQAVAGAVKNGVILSCCTGPRSQYSYGLSLYFPWAVLHDSYSKLGLAQESGWFDFLLRYLERTRRTDRHKHAEGEPLRGLVLSETKQHGLREVLTRRGRPELRGDFGIGFYERTGIASSYAASLLAESRYAASRYAASRYAASRYAASRFGTEGDELPVTRWVQNPPTGSGGTCYEREKYDGDDFPLACGS